MLLDIFLTAWPTEPSPGVKGFDFPDRLGWVHSEECAILLSLKMCS
jgi:hypothetical protein